jgi:hypothetical protein
MHTNWQLYQLYGITISSDFPFSIRLSPALSQTIPELLFTCTSKKLYQEVSLETPVYSSKSSDRDGKSWITLFQVEKSLFICIKDMAVFLVEPDHIECEILDPTRLSLIEMYFLSVVISLWSECRGNIALHASSVMLNGHLIAFLANSGNGKSTIASEWIRAGASLFGDDILIIEKQKREFIAHPTFPQMKMWPAEVKFFLEKGVTLEKVSFDTEKRWVPMGRGGYGRFCDQSQSISRFYILDRSLEESEGIEIEPISTRDALLKFIRFSYIPRMMESLGFQGKRFLVLGELASQVSMRKVSYPTGYSYLPVLREAILLDLDKKGSDFG